MKNVAILALDDAAATTITAPFDIFSLTGVLWNLGQGEDFAPQFKVEIVSPNGKPIKCLNNLTIMPHRAMEEVEEADLVMISSVLDIHRTLKRQGEIINWLIDRYQQGAWLASICTGTFALAETGLLDGKNATTHWRAIDEFRSLYPRVILQPDRLIADAGALFSSGGFNSAFDLSNYLVERLCGRLTAVQTVKSLVNNMAEGPPSSYAMSRFHHHHDDKPIIRAQEILESHYTENMDIDTLAQRCGLGRRTLERRFKKATGDTPLVYLQRIRVEKAKRLLESESLSFGEISNLVGYEDAAFFRKLFIKHTDLRPNQYRAKFIRPLTAT